MTIDRIERIESLLKDPDTRPSIKMDYSEESSGIDFLTKEDEVELANIIQLGRLATVTLFTPEAYKPADIWILGLAIERYKRAQTRFVTANLPRVRSIADKKYPQISRNSHLNFSDLMQEGTLGVLRASETFDPTKGARFGTYAHIWINEFMDNLIDYGARDIHIPLDIQRAIGEIGTAIITLNQQYGRRPNGRRPSMTELSIYTGFAPEKIKEIIRSNKSSYTLSLSEPRSLSEDDSSTIGETVPDNSAIDPAESSQYTVGVNQVLEEIFKRVGLDEKGAQIFKMRYGDDLSLDQIGAIYDISKQRVDQISGRQVRKKILNLLQEEPDLYEALHNYLSPDPRGIEYPPNSPRSKRLPQSTGNLDLGE